MTRRRNVTAEERRLWHLVMRGTDPMPGREPVPDEPPPAPVLDVAAPTPEPHPSGAPPRPPAATARPAPAPLQPGLIHGVDRRTAERLRRGRLEIDGRIDLHGMTQETAHAALAGFVHRAWADGRRCVLVITGKGRGGDGVLRRAVPRWLAEPALARMVLALQPAQPMHGGEGALYVLVKRRRDGATR